MKKRYINATFFLLIVLIIAFCGLYLGRNIIQNSYIYENSNGKNWHKLLHDKLHFTAQQDKKLDNIEKDYRQKQQYLKDQIHLANIELAEAIKQDKSLSLKVQIATDKIHKIMGKLQKLTLEHLFDMRHILNDKQNKKLEQMVADALYDNK